MTSDLSLNETPSTWLVPKRTEQLELLDLGRGHQGDVNANLVEMARSNRYLGGLRALTLHLYPRILKCADAVTLADLGTGSAQVPLSLARWAQRQHKPVMLSIWGVDWAGRNLNCARAVCAMTPSIRLVQANATRLPFAPGQFDFVISSLFLHHFAPAEVVDLLRYSYAHTRRSLIMTDIVRGWLPLVGFRLVQPLFARHPFTRHDGALSIRRAYTPGELRELACAAGVPDPRITTHWPWRMTLTVDRPQ